MKASDSDNLAYVLKNFTNYSHGTVGQESVGRGADWLGVKLLNDKDHKRVADRLLRRNWHGKKSASAMMIMAREVELSVGSYTLMERQSRTRESANLFSHLF